jgi:hypothetical protein
MDILEHRTSQICPTRLSGKQLCCAVSSEVVCFIYRQEVLQQGIEATYLETYQQIYTSVT